MEKQIFRLKSIMAHLFGEDGIDVSTFQKRLILQKAIYLTQITPLDLGYRFSWYVHGPYSPDLTETAYRYNNNREYYNNAKGSFRLSDAGKAKVNHVSNLINWRTENELIIDDDKWLELLASIHYLKHIAYFSNEVEITKQSIPALLAKHGKGNFEESEIDQAWDALNSKDLINNKTIPV